MTRRSLGSRLALSLAAFVLAAAAWNWQAEAPAQENQPAEAGAGAQPGQGADGQPTAAKPPKSRIRWFLESSGWIGALLLVLSIYFIATVSRLFVELRQQVAMPPAVIEQCRSLVDGRDFQGVYNLVKGDDSFFSLVLTAGMAELANGLAEARDAMERVGEVVTVEMEKKISMLAVLGTLGPMIGLLGTLKGMISSFSVIALQGVTLDAQQVAEGISEALLLTFEGVALSVPAIYFFAIFRNRVSTITAATMLEADEFIRRMIVAAKAKVPGTTIPTATPMGKT